MGKEWVMFKDKELRIKLKEERKEFYKPKRKKKRKIIHIAPGEKEFDEEREMYISLPNT